MKYLAIYTQPANIGPQDVPRTPPSNVPRTSPKDPILPSRRCPRGRLNLTFKGRPWEIDSGRPQDALRTSLEDLQSTQTWMSKIFLNLSFRTYSIDQI